MHCAQAASRSGSIRARSGAGSLGSAIRKQIKTCVLFIPVISRHTHDRDEGYFRLEWKLAVDRSHLMTSNRAFLLPVVIDETREDDENVPDRFKDIHWTRLPAGRRRRPSSSGYGDWWRRSPPGRRPCRRPARRPRWHHP